ncbi:MAG: C1 family peptidase, partial [Rubrivivax sp.]
MPARSLSIGARSFTLDARPDRLDLRDLRYQPALGHLAPRLPEYGVLAPLLAASTQAGLMLDQGQDCACTGFGLAAVINHLRLLSAREQGQPPPPGVNPAMLYRLARLYDEWPGEDYEGSSCRGALKGWHRHGVCREALWPADGPVEDAARRDEAERNWDVAALGCTLGVYYRIEVASVVSLQAALRDTGAVYVCSTVHEGWALPPSPLPDTHAALPTIAHVVEPRQPGTHAYALVGYDEVGFIVQNSWGTRWGAGGFARLPYEAWVAHGEDAWVFTLGVPRRAASADPGPDVAARAVGGAAAAAARSPRHRLPLTEALRRPAHARAAGSPTGLDEAAGHTLVLDRGFAVRRDITAADVAEDVARTAFERPLAWLRAQRSRKLLVYVHGGLNSEADALARARQLAPHALAQGIYPLFLAWRTGALETAADLLEKAWARATGSPNEPPPQGLQATGRHALAQLSERTDRLLEVIARPPGLALWGQMKLNAERASHHREGGVRTLVAQCRALHTQLPGGLELHLAGHSAGAIVIGAMLGVLREAGLRVRTPRLFAPACTTRFAMENYAP